MIRSDLQMSLQVQAPSPQSSPQGRGGHRSRVSWESGRETVREAPGEGRFEGGMDL